MNKNPNNTNIYNKARFYQKVVFAGMDNKLAGTDIDYVCDIKGKAMVYAELKANNTKITVGQEIMMKNIVKSSKIPCLFIMATHKTPTTHKDIVFSEAKVAFVYHNLHGDLLVKSETNKGLDMNSMMKLIESKFL